MAEQRSLYGSFLARFSPRVQKKLLDIAETFQFKAGQDIIGEGDHSLYLYIVKSGRISVEMDIPTRGRRMLRTGSAGTMFSWSALVEPCLATAAVRAMEDTVVLGIKGGALIDACREDFEMGFELYRALTEVIASRLIATRLQLVDVFSAG